MMSRAKYKKIAYSELISQLENTDVKLKGGYDKDSVVGNFEHVFVCTDHGEFVDNPYRVFSRKHKCPACPKSNTIKYDTEKYQLKLNEKFGNTYTVIEEYRGSMFAIKHKCNVHNKIFLKKPNYLKVKGCPDCSMEGKRGQGYTEKEFLSLSKKVSPGIKVLGKYQGSRNKVLCECKVCKHRWYPRAEVLVRKNNTGCPECNKSFFESKGEIEVREFLNQYVATDKRILHTSSGSFEADILIESKRLIVEYNGEYFHSYPRKEKNYHYNKRKMAESLGYSIVFVWEDDWKNKKKIVQRLLLNRIGAYSKDTLGARKCEVRELKKVPSRFYDKYHIQGKPRGGITFGLKYGNKIVAAMTFSHTISNRGSKKRDGHFELVRFVTSKNIPGGASKLLRSFEITYSPKTIVSFSDCDYFSGGLYSQLGFVAEEELKPDYFSWSQKYGKQHKSFTRKSNLQKILSNYDPQLTEFENCVNAHIHHCYNSGKIRWVKHYETS